MGGKLQLLSGEVCRVRWEKPRQPVPKGRLNLQKSAEAIVLAVALRRGRAERESEVSSWCVREASEEGSQAGISPPCGK